MATAMADGDATERAAVMVDGDRNGNGRRQRRWATAMAMVIESVTMMEMATGITMATATVTVTMMKAGLPLHVWGCAVLWQGQHLASTPMDTKEGAFTSAASWG